MHILKVKWYGKMVDKFKKGDKFKLIRSSAYTDSSVPFVAVAAKKILLQTLQVL